MTFPKHNNTPFTYSKTINIKTEKKIKLDAATNHNSLPKDEGHQ